MERTFLRRAAPYVIGIVAVGFVSGWLSNSGYGNPWFDRLDKPWFMPPGWAFPVAWTTLYVMLGFVAALGVDAPDSEAKAKGLKLFGAQMLLNFMWSPIFFGMREPGIALGVIVVMLVTALGAALFLGRVRPLAGWLMVPYLLWLCFATALNWHILALNPGA